MDLESSIRNTQGCLIEVDPSIKEFIQHISSSSGSSRSIIRAELDERHLLIDPKQLDFIMKEVDNLHERNTFIEDPEEDV
ncbi:hypothetical protein J8273_0728 [Carpediemonas membranifera]|uniref:General transcription and DNA repair factor IIH subunit TFB5 n=1 Tax=Carpediemonas membranifera TaxID=201153 RepID=A0A8J6E4T4_9EUKA|nr:hypothetical protein J8273_0728 [Carpediemonas membranifera]|eukprot:KAG9397598.1 hypothetical protein J8273_0728 [Carpediemonas membranifera]